MGKIPPNPLVMTSWPGFTIALPERYVSWTSELSSGPLALIASKRILQEQYDWSSEEMWEKQGAISGPVFASEDAKEGASAFKEKRDPVWQGS